MFKLVGSVRRLHVVAQLTHTNPQRAMQARMFSSSLTRSNLIADLYIKEVKAFKPKPASAADAEAATRPWKAPQPTAAPALEAEGADALAEYDSQAVDVGAAATTGDVATPEPEYNPDGWFVFEEEEPPHH